MSAEVAPFHLALGEELVASADAKLFFSRELTAYAAGGPTRDTAGRLFLTTGCLAFRPMTIYAYAPSLTIGLGDVVAVERGNRRLLSLVPLPGARLDVTARVSGREFLLRITVNDVDGWITRIEEARAAMKPKPSADALIDQAVAAGVSDPGRYVPALARLSFPQAFWHTEALDDLRDVIDGVLGDLGVRELLPWPEFLDQLMPTLQVEVETGPEDYETGEGSEQWGRIEQVTRIMTAVNAALPPDAPKRFYRFAETLPGWESDEPVWLYLTQEQVEGLTQLGIVTIYER